VTLKEDQDTQPWMILSSATWGNNFCRQLNLSANTWGCSKIWWWGRLFGL